MVLHTRNIAVAHGSCGTERVSASDAVALYGKVRLVLHDRGMRGEEGLAELCRTKKNLRSESE